MTDEDAKVSSITMTDEDAKRLIEIIAAGVAKGIALALYGQKKDEKAAV